MLVASVVRAAQAVNAIGAVAVATQVAVAGADILTQWLLGIVSAVLAVSLAVNTYFLRGLAQSVRECNRESSKQSERIARLETRYDFWFAYEHDEHGFDRRRDPDRRRREREDDRERRD